MKTLLFVAVALVIAALLAVAALRKKSGAVNLEGPWPFYAKKPLSTPEQILYHRMVNALPEHIVLAQVQVSRVLGVKKGFNFHEWNNRINRLSYDFVVCSKDSTVLFTVELDELARLRESHHAHKDVGGSVEARIKTICDAALPGKRVEVDDNLFEIGASSLTLIQIHEEIDREYPGLVDLTELFDFPTVAQLAKHLEAKLASQAG